MEVWQLFNNFSFTDSADRIYAAMTIYNIIYFPWPHNKNNSFFF